MQMDERFSKRKSKRFAVRASESINLVDGAEDDSTRILVIFRPIEVDDDRTLCLRMSQDEARALGKALLRYADMALLPEGYRVMAPEGFGRSYKG